MLGAFRCLQKDSWRKLYYREPLKEKIRFTKVEDNREEKSRFKGECEPTLRRHTGRT